jgi:Zn ribbon nucleic-acid-binding protein
MSWIHLKDIKKNIRKYVAGCNVYFNKTNTKIQNWIEHKVNIKFCKTSYLRSETKEKTDVS